MRTFHQFRVWLHRGPLGEQVAAGVAIALAIALLTWGLVPLGHSSSNDEVAAGSVAAGPAGAGATGDGSSGAQQGGAAGATATTVAGATGATATGGVRGGAAGATATGGQGDTAAATADRCSGLKASDQGVTASEVLIAFGAVDLAGPVGNATFGARDDMDKVAAAIAAGINAEGGVACRKVRVKAYKINPIDSNDARSKCLQVVADKPFAVIDMAGFFQPVDRDCLPEHKLPYIGAGYFNQDELARYGQYLFSAISGAERMMRNNGAGLATMGAFDPAKGFKKLGVITDSCVPKANDGLRQTLAKYGVGEDKLSWFTLDCQLLSPPNQLAAAVAQHRRDGATTVLLQASISDSQNYVKTADGVGYHPVWTTGDYGLNTSGVSSGGWPDAFDGVTAITGMRGGEMPSGIGNPLRDQCNGWVTKGGIAPVTKDNDAPFIVCDMFRLFKAAADTMGADLVRTGLVPAVSKLGTFKFGGFLDGIYNGKATTGDFIRAISWHKDCKCWKVADDPRPGF